MKVEHVQSEKKIAKFSEIHYPIFTFPFNWIHLFKWIVYFTLKWIKLCEMYGRHQYNFGFKKVRISSAQFDVDLRLDKLL